MGKLEIVNRKPVIDSHSKICTTCIYDENVPAIKFDDDGVCNYCKMIEDLKTQYKTATPEGEKDFFEIVEQIKKHGNGKKYDCVVGVSGGTDSSYMIIKAVEWGLRPLAVHYDNTWNTAIATENIRKILGKLNIDLYTHVVDNKEADDIFKSFFLANVPEIDGPTDIALAETLYRAASKFGVKYILEGHSFIAEGVSPLSSAYVDGAYIKNIHKMFGKIKMKTFPNMNFASFMKWILVKRIKKIRPLWYIPYSKKDAQAFLEKEYDWKYYGGHHLENRMTAFNHSVYFPQKFGIDQRNNSLSASVRAGLLSQKEAINEYNSNPLVEDDLIGYFKKRLNLTDQKYADIMNGDRKTYRDYPTYKKRFEKLRPLFFILAKANLVPMSFYIKYTSKSEM
ncbi:N-acetyl sugar amidotransferase [Aquimarina megaterium]|uniref:N-acetyl sugar amidotransferase n=1 Tax=Aquimarina megaterium TaxID=1443666 RepID=UPI000687ABA5|nr:N-acetyl sugar amidotransferase [Aquimarina megaterium]